MYVLAVASLHSLLQASALAILVYHRRHFALRHTQVPLIAGSTMANMTAQLLLGLKMAHLIPCAVMLAGLTVCFPMALFLGQHLRALALILSHAHQVRLPAKLQWGEEELLKQQEELSQENRSQRNKRLTPFWHGWLLLMLSIVFTCAMAVMASLLLHHHRGGRCVSVWLYAPLLLCMCLLVLIGLPVMMVMLWRLPEANLLRKELLVSTTTMGSLLSVYLLMGSI